MASLALWAEKRPHDLPGHMVVQDIYVGVSADEIDVRKCWIRRIVCTYLDGPVLPIGCNIAIPVEC